MSLREKNEDTKANCIHGQLHPRFFGDHFTDALPWEFDDLQSGRNVDEVVSGHDGAGEGEDRR